jgi:hypothetical protein
MLLSAFYKLPEILTSDFSSNSYYEAYIANMFSMAVLLELNSNNIDSPLTRIKIEPPYSNSENHHADLLIELLSPVSNDILRYYGINCHNWIEAKYFAGLARKKEGSNTTEPKVKNIALIIKDILRLCFYIEELQGEYRENGRFLLLLFNEKPDKYLSFDKNDKSRRVWLDDLFSQGRKTIKIDISSEPNTIKKYTLNEKLDINSITIECDVHSFEPLFIYASNTTFYGYFINIFKFDIMTNGIQFSYDTYNNIYWGPEKVNQLKELSTLFGNIDSEQDL